MGIHNKCHPELVKGWCRKITLKKMSKKLFLSLFLLASNASAHNTNYLPLGDGKVSTEAKSGYIFSCQTEFKGGGAFNAGDWISGDKWYPDNKPNVQGSVSWPNHLFTIETVGEKRLIKSNDLPDHPTGTFPIAYSDPAYSFDRNPNSILEQNIVLTLPTNPKIASQPSCLNMGMIGIALTGVAIFNGLDASGRDAAAHEVQDSCNGHPERQGTYHYHNMSPCMKDNAGKQGKHSDLAGYAIDGFGIYGQYGENGKALSNKDLDECHGHTHLIIWNGVPQEIYHYHLTKEYPYTLSCFRGEVKSKMRQTMPAKQDGPWSAEKFEMKKPHQVMKAVAEELNVDQKELAEAVDPPPPNFTRAAKQLGISESKLREAFEKARGN